ncbi:hypothetical protein ACFL38_03640 [Candidatus Omnitrophota bacterium]
MKPVPHLIGSAVIGGLFFTFTRSLSSSIACFVAGVLYDLDHFVDYLIHYRKRAKGLKHFYTACVEVEMERSYIVLHSYELIMILWICIVVLQLELVWLAIAIGITQHIMLDQFGNKGAKQKYFLWYRAKKRFQTKDLFLGSKKK